MPAVQSGSGQVTWSMIVLLHEYAHHFLISSNVSAMPRWLSEGSAEFFASAKFEADGGLWLGRPASHRAGELLYAQDVKAADLLDPTDYDKRKHTSYDAFYGKSWLLYHYLTFGGDRKGQFTRYTELLANGRGQRAAALEAFGDFDKLEKDLDHYLRQRRMTALTLKPELLTIGPVSLRTLSAGRRRSCRCASVRGAACRARKPRRCWSRRGRSRRSIPMMQRCSPRWLSVNMTPGTTRRPSPPPIPRSGVILASQRLRPEGLCAVPRG
ncbi:DUF1570 domain-containing protein [Novosphingobium resinovorum]